jgi:undecaprenyl-diphosphatase
MGILEAILYGIVQGLTEFLPISSTAHLRILPTLFGWQDPGSGFTAVIQLGTLLAVLVYFWKDLTQVFLGWCRSLTNKELRQTHEARIGWGIFFGTIPIVVLGFLFRKQISHDLRSLYVVAVMLIVMGLLMGFAERRASTGRNFEQLTMKDGLIVGFFQAIALIPGASRSGSTITGALFAGIDRATAARFSFLLSVPSVLAAGIFEAYNERKAILGAELLPTIVATVVSFFFGYLAIAFLIRFLQKRGTGPFVAYRVILGVVLLIVLTTGRLDPMAGIPLVP